MAAPRDSHPEYRCERKFSSTDITAHEMQCILRLHPALFVEPYLPRWVNNCYLESHALHSYWDNRDGVPDRVKARVRWYGELFGDVDAPALELKIKAGSVGRKRRFALPPFTLDEGFSQRRLHALIRGAGLPADVTMDVLRLSPVLINRYWRRYYVSSDGLFRATLDTHVCYYRVLQLNNQFAQRVLDRQQIIVELKYAPEHETGASAIAARFPLALSRNSKYANGLDSLYTLDA